MSNTSTCKDYQDMWDNPDIEKFGECEEKVCYEEDDGSVYRAFLQVGNVKACFCGHDHYNNYWRIHQGGIFLAYGYISGEATNYNWPTGGKLIAVPLKNRDINVKNVMPDSEMRRLDKKWQYPFELSTLQPRKAVPIKCEE